MKITEICTKNSLQTKKSGQILAKELLKDIQQQQRATVIGMVGDLGSGKTTFIQGLAKGFGINDKITSPTFALLKRYAVKKKTDKSNPLFLCHFDCYRLNSAQDMAELGLDEMIKDPINIIVIEWADKISKIMPNHTIWLNFEYINKNERKIIYEYISFN